MLLRWRFIIGHHLAFQYFYNVSIRDTTVKIVIDCSLEMTPAESHVYRDNAKSHTTPVGANHLLN